MEEVVSFTLQVKPPAMTDDAVFKFSKKMRPYQVTMNIEYQNLAGTTLRADVTVHPQATIEEVFTALHLKVDERLDHPTLSQRVNNFGPAQPPWMNGQYRFWSEEDLSQRLIVTTRDREMSIIGKKHKPEEWDARVREAIGRDVTLVQKT
jgi:hypothetical protein